MKEQNKRQKNYRGEGKDGEMRWKGDGWKSTVGQRKSNLPYKTRLAKDKSVFCESMI